MNPETIQLDVTESHAERFDEMLSSGQVNKAAFEAALMQVIDDSYRDVMLPDQEHIPDR